MASLTPIITQIISTGPPGQPSSVITQVGELPVSYVTHMQFASSAWKQFSEALPTSILDYAWDLEDALSIVAYDTEPAVVSMWQALPTEVVDYLSSVYDYQGDHDTTFSTHWREVQVTSSSIAPQAPTDTIGTANLSSTSDAVHQSNQDKLLPLAIALPICLASAFLILGLLVWWKRHRIVQDLHRKYFSPGFYHESKRSSGDNTPSANTPMSDLPIRVCETPDTQHFQHPGSGSGSRRPDNPLRSLGTPNFPGPRQHLMEKTRCITPDTPSGRREQLESRAQLIQEVHQRAREGSITPDLLDHRARRVVSLDRVNEERTEPERPSSPTGSIRMVEAAHVPRRAASDAIRTTLDEVFQPQWSPVTSREPSM